MSITSLISTYAKNPHALIEHVEAQIARATDASGEGARVFVALDPEKIRAQARTSRERYANGHARALEGITISVKDLFDVEGEVTTAGSVVLKDRAAAERDAVAVQRLRDAGAIIFGRTNMTEFAFSGVGINPHYGTPRSVWDRRADGAGRIPGGSSSGGGVSVADGFCDVALGTDTGGSVRIPSAFNGLVGFKPTAYRVPILGGIPLSVMHDSIGPLASSVDDCARIDAVLSAEPLFSESIDVRALKFLKPQSIIWDALDPEVAAASRAAIEKLRAAGASIVDAPLEMLDEAYKLSSPSISALALDWHTEHINADGEGYDPRVWTRMQLGKDATRAQISSSIAYRRFWVDRMNIAIAGYDAVLCPTVACIAPVIGDLPTNDELFFHTNSRILRNTNWANALDGCAITLPCHAKGDAPVGLQLVAAHARDAHLFAVARACESVMNS